MSAFDLPLDPEGDAYTAFLGDDRFRYAIICRGRKHYTNSKKRFKAHYRRASRRGLPGTWFKKDDFGMFRWWKIVLSEHAL